MPCRLFTLVGAVLSALFLVAAGAAIAAGEAQPRGHGEVRITSDNFDQSERAGVTGPVLDQTGTSAGDRTPRRGGPIERW